MSERRGMYEEQQLVRSFDGHLFRRLMRYLKPYRWAVAGALLLLILTSALEISTTFIIQIGIDDYMSVGNTAGFRWIAALFLAVILATLAAAAAQLYLTMWLGQKVLHDIRTEVFAHLQRLPVAFLDRNPIGRLITRATSDVATLNELFSTGVVTILGDVLMLVLIVAALLYYNWQLALLTFIVLPLLAVATIWFRAKIRRQYRAIRTRIAKLNAFVQERVTGIDQVHLFNLEDQSRTRFAGINSRVLSANLKSVYYTALFLPAVEIIGALSIAILLYAGGIRVEDGVLTFGGLVAFIQLVERFYQPVQSLSEEFGVMQASMAASERIFQLLDTEPMKTGPSSPPPADSQKSDIAFEQVWFAYENEDWVLKDVTFRVDAGEKIAIVGATGAGKTSLVSLLFRFYDHQKGLITLGGTPISKIPISCLRSQLGLVQQDNTLFAGTVADNIRLGNPGISDSAMYSALEQVGFFSSARSEGENRSAVLNREAAALSTGQKQLLSLARVLAHDPKILILDEATSSIDTETERLVERAVDCAMQNRTSIIIAHRLSTVRKADKILAFHRGELREAGSHDNLLAAGGIYKKLYRMQFETPDRTEIRS